MADGMLKVRAFWKYRNERASSDRQREVDADVFIDTRVRRPLFDSLFEFTERGYRIGRTPLDVVLPPGDYTIVCEYSGTGRFEQRIQKANVRIKDNKKSSTNFYFEVIGAGSSGPPTPRPAPAPEPTPTPRPTTPEPGHKFKLEIESQPMLQVPVNIFRIIIPQRLTQNILGMLYGPGLGQSIYEVVEIFRREINTFSGKRGDAKKWLDEELKSRGIEYPGDISELILKSEFYRPQKLINQNESVRLEGSGRWRPRGDLLRPIGENYKTAVYLDLEEGNYLISVPEEVASEFYHGSKPKDGNYKFERWHVYIWDNVRNAFHEEPITETSNEIEIYLGRPTRVVAYYYKKAEHTHQGSVLSPYQRGTMTGHGFGAAKDTIFGALGSQGVRNKISMETKPTKEQFLWGTKKSKDPYMLAAINKGKRLLNGYAKAEYSRVFDPLKREYKRRADELRQMQRSALRARANLRIIITKQMRAAKMGALRFRDEDTINVADQLAAPGAALAGNTALITARDTLRRYLDARDKYFEDYKKDFESASAHLRDYLENKAGIISTMISRKYRMGINSPDENALRDELIRYSAVLAEDFATRGRTMGHALMRGLGIASRGLETGGATFGNILYNMVQFVFGPWTITTIFVLINFFFVLTFVGYNIQILWVMPAIGAGIAFLLNFSDNVQPLNWITHLASGALIGYGAALLLVVLRAPTWSFIGGSNSIGFWIAWAFLGFIGLFQFYQSGGYKVILQGSVIILLLAYLALGPYQAYFNNAVDQVKAPIELAYRSVERAVTDVWLLATNPTEWYARQQVINARPEKPLSVPKGLEITSLEALPSHVPAGQQFALAAVIKNDGVLDNVTDIVLSLGCNQWCEPRFVYTNYNETPTQEAEARIGKELSDKIRKGDAFYLKSNLTKGESFIVSVQPLVANYIAVRAGETKFAKIKFNLSYIYSTQSSLQTSVISQEEMQRRFVEGDSVFKQVMAVSKPTPAQLSLNVGPQPLRAGEKSILLVSVYNTRDKSKVILRSGESVIIKMPRVIGTDLNCNGFVDDNTDNDPDVETVNFIIRPVMLGQENIEILPNEFNSIFAFICTFRAAEDVDTLRTGLITAYIQRYTFVIEQTKDVPITPPLGIIFEPYEGTCNSANDEDTCNKLTKPNAKGEFDPKTTCYYEYAGSEVVSIFGSTCRVCGSVPNNCEKFLSEQTCRNGANACHWSCQWVPGGTHKISNVDLEGRCVAVNVTDGGGGSNVGRDCTAMNICVGYSGNNNNYEPSRLIDTTAEDLISNSGVPVDKIAVGAVMYSESRCKHYLDNGNVKCSVAKAMGLMQLIPSTAAEQLNGDSNLACDPRQNVVGGAKYLRWLYDRYASNQFGTIDEDTRWKFTFGAYNTGPGNMDNAIRRAGSNDWSKVKPLLSTQTQTYVDGGGGQPGVFNAYKNPTPENNCYYGAGGATQQSTAAFWKINGKRGPAETGFVEIGEVEGDRFFARIDKVEGSKFTITLTTLDNGVYDYVDCKGGLTSGYEAVLGQGDEAECDTRGTFNPIAIVSGDDINLKLVSVDYANKNILLSVGPEPFYGPGRNPLPDWKLCANNVCADMGRAIQYKLPIDVDTRIALSSVDTTRNEATFIVYTKEGFAGWFEADCSDWPFRNAVTMSVGETEGCVSSDLLQFTENFVIRLDSIDAATKTVKISMPKLG